MISLSSVHLIPRPMRMRVPRPLLNYTAMWAVLLMVTGAVLSVFPEMAFMSAISPSSSFSRACDLRLGSVRLPLDLPGESVCLPAHLFSGRSGRIIPLDFFVPSVFAAIIVAVSICIIRAMALWEDD